MAGTIIGVLLIVFIVLALLSHNQQKHVNAGKKINAAGVLVCTRCGGAQFVAKRSMGGKILFGVFAPKTRVKCVTCGAETGRYVNDNR
jgi:DNA-directed RNA polymerase subunit RPC12/RpoP